MDLFDEGPAAAAAAAAAAGTQKVGNDIHHSLPMGFNSDSMSGKMWNARLA